MTEAEKMTAPTDTTAPQSFYERIDDTRFRSTRATVGPWSPVLQHAGPPAALLGHVLERTDPQPGARIARVSIEILGPIAVDDLQVTAEVIRAGRRVELLGATASARGRAVLRANAWQIAAEPGRSPAAGDREPAPPLPPEQPQRFFPGVDAFPYGEALEWRFVEGDYEHLGPAIVWARCRFPLVRGEPMSGLCRLLAMVDSANGVSAELPLASWTFVPVDLTVVLHRDPVGEWVGMHATTTIEADGVGMTRTRLFDLDGTLGGSLHTLYVAPR
jgi:hypothetical protein